MWNKHLQEVLDKLVTTLHELPPPKQICIMSASRPNCLHHPLLHNYAIWCTHHPNGSFPQRTFNWHQMCPGPNKVWNKGWNKGWMPPINKEYMTEMTSQYSPGLLMLLPSWTLPIPLKSALWNWVKEHIHGEHGTTYRAVSLWAQPQLHVNLSPIHCLLQLLPCNDLQGWPTQTSSWPTQTLSQPLLRSRTYILSLSKEGCVIEILYHKRP